jgi:hypothetical protein
MNHLYYNAVPTYTFTSNVNNIGNNFAARPIRHWRKQLKSAGNSRSNIIGMPMDRPGELIPATDTCNTCNNVKILEEKINKDSSCTSCNPIKSNVQISNTAYTSNTAYMQSRCVTYDQRLAYNRAPFVNYFSPTGVTLEPSDSSTGSQIRETNNCYNNYASPTTYVSPPTYACNTTIYKPNNSQFGQQGGVSSGSRLARLKYNTLNNNGAEYNSASGALGVNSGRYQSAPSPSYYNKFKPQRVFFPHKTGASTYCKPEYSMCMNE